MDYVDTRKLTEGFRLRATREEVETWRAAAAEEGISIAAWLRQQASQNPTAKDAQRAHGAVQQALKKGELQRQPCEVCGAAAQAHHDDYTKPLQVRWLCKHHHKQWHKEHPSGIDWSTAPMLAICLSDEEYKAVAEAAARDQRTLSAWVRLRLREELERQKGEE